jgi:high affinity sulfate transporter 1
MLYTGPPARWRHDLVAGITLAAYLVPAGIGDASLAGLPPESGLYACLFAGLLYWLLCSSQHTAITVTSAISLLIGTSLGDMAGGDLNRYWNLASATAILAAGIALAAWLLRAGVLVDFISETVMIGFKMGVALHLISTQLPKLFGFKGTHGDFPERLHYFLVHLHETNALALAVGAGALVLLLMGKSWLKNKPVALFVMAAAILVSLAGELGAHGVRLLGRMPQGLPAIGWPAVSAADLNDLLPLAMACFLLGAVETAAIGRMFALKHGYRLESNRELLALAAGNLAAGLGRGYPVSGGMSQSLVNEGAGARTPISGLIAAGIILLVLLFISGVLRNLPEPVLAAIVLTAVTGLIKISALKRLWRFSRWEFAIAMVALLGVLGSGLLRGVLIGAILSLIVLLRRGSRPHTVELGRVPGTQQFGDIERHPENERLPGVFIFRADTSLLYFNVDFIRDRFLALLAARDDKPPLAIFHLGTVPMVDLAGAEMLIELHRTMKEHGGQFHIAEAHGNVRDALRRAGYETACGKVEANRSVTDCLSQLEVPLTSPQESKTPASQGPDTPGIFHSKNP